MRAIINVLFSKARLEHYLVVLLDLYRTITIQTRPKLSSTRICPRLRGRQPPHHKGHCQSLRPSLRINMSMAAPRIINTLGRIPVSIEPPQQPHLVWGYNTRTT